MRESVPELFTPDQLRDLERRRFRPAESALPAERARGAVLFGAGGGGRFLLRFLRIAGVEPGFFVDNNEALWGTAVDGVEVRPPAALREDPDRLVVLCTAYYLRQQEEQCRALGVRATAPYYNFSGPPFPFVIATDDEAREILAGEAPRRAGTLWADETSRVVYRGTLAFRVTQDVRDMPPYERGEYFLPELFRERDYARFVDGGAFDGDTLREFLRVTQGRFERYDAFEPDPENFRALQGAVAALPPGVGARVHLFPLALGAAAGEASFQCFGNACSAVGEGGGIRVAVAALDELPAGEAPTYVKLDVEGAEPEALAGMERAIRRCRPALAVCVYHAVDHLWRIPAWIAGLGLGYRLYLRKHSESYSETVLYALP